MTAEETYQEMVEVLSGLRMITHQTEEIVKEAKPRPARPTAANMRHAAEAIRGDLMILSGSVVGPSDVSWQDVAGTLAVNMRSFANALDEQRTGRMLFNGGAPTTMAHIITGEEQ
jgi:hypothetical protein